MLPGAAQLGVLVGQDFRLLEELVSAIKVVPVDQLHREGVVSESQLLAGVEDLLSPGAVKLELRHKHLLQELHGALEVPRPRVLHSLGEGLLLLNLVANLVKLFVLGQRRREPRVSTLTLAPPPRRRRIILLIRDQDEGHKLLLQPVLVLRQPRQRHCAGLVLPRREL